MSTKLQLRGARVLVTGGTSGIGRATAALLHERGARVLVCARKRTELPEGVAFASCDLGDEREREALAAHVVRELGGLDLLINNAGIQLQVQLSDRAECSALHAELALNLSAPIHLTTLLLPALLGAARPAAVVNVTSALAFAPKASAPIYCATKAALASWSTTLRLQLAGSNVRVLEAIPPLVETAMTRGRAGRKMTPEKVAVALVRALERGDERALIGPARWLWLLHRIVPGLAARLMAKN